MNREQVKSGMSLKDSRRGTAHDDVDGSDVPLGVPPTTWAMIEQRGVEVSFPSGATMLRHGASGRSWFAIVSGTVLVTVTSTQGATLVLARRSAGELVGELAALEGEPRAATVSAKDDVVALKLGFEDLAEILRADPEWALSLLQSLAGQLRSLSNRYALRSEDLRHRLEALLSTHLEETGQYAFRSTREELAGWVGATREATVRALQVMRSEGIVQLGRGSVEIVDADRSIS